MALTEIVPGLHQVGLSMVNAFLLLDNGELTLIDTGIGGSAPKILAGASQLGQAAEGHQADPGDASARRSHGEPC